MNDQKTDPHELGYYFALAQAGLEMVAPMGIGLLIDYGLDTSPWGLIVGTILGFTGGIAHMVMMVQRHDAQKKKKNEDQKP